MGKKKDKASKSKKKKSDSETVVGPESESNKHAEPETANIQPAEYVTAQDVMELVNSLSYDLEQLNKSNQALQQQIAQAQKTLQRHSAVFMIVALILVAGIVITGYTTAKTNARMVETIGNVTTNIDQTTQQFKTISTSINAVSLGLKNLNTGFNNLSTNLLTANENINKLMIDVNRINTEAASQPYAPWRADPRWR